MYKFSLSISYLICKLLNTKKQQWSSMKFQHLQCALLPDRWCVGLAFPMSLIYTYCVLQHQQLQDDMQNKGTQPGYSYCFDVPCHSSSLCHSGQHTGRKHMALIPQIQVWESQFPDSVEILLQSHSKYLVTNAVLEWCDITQHR